MQKQDILNELKKRNVNIDNLSTNKETVISKDLILNELEKRGLKQTKSGEFLKTSEQVAKENPFGTIYDDMELPEMTAESQAVYDYLSSKEFGRLALEITGGVVGAMYPPVAIARAATLVRPALQGLVTRMAGAGFGEAVGAGVSQTFDPRFDAKDDFIEIAGDVSKDLLRAFATGATGEGAGALINKGISKVIGRNKKLIEGADEAVETIEKQKAKIISNPDSYSKKIRDAAEVGQLTPALLQEGQLIDLIENVSEMSLVGGGLIRYAREGAEEIAQSGMVDFLTELEKLGGKESIGKLFQKTLTKDYDAWKAVANSKYKALDDALSSKSFANKFQVDLSDLKKMAREELGNLGAKSESKGLEKFLQGIINEDNYVTFKKANSIRSDYLEIARRKPIFSDDPLPAKKARLATIAESKINNAINNASVPDSTKDLLRQANKHYREGVEVFNEDLFKDIIKKDPDLVYKSIVASGDRSNLIDETFSIIDKRFKDKATNNLLKNKIRGSFLKDVITKSQKQNNQFGSEIDSLKLSKILSQKEQTLKSMFNTEQIKELKKLQNALLFSQGRLKKRGALPGAIFIQMKQSGALMQLFGAGLATGGGMSGVGASILIAPAAMAKAFTNPKIVKALTLGFKYNENPTVASRYFLQAVTQMQKENLISQDELDNIKKDIKEAGY